MKDNCIELSVNVHIDVSEVREALHLLDNVVTRIMKAHECSALNVDQSSTSTSIEASPQRFEDECDNTTEKSAADYSALGNIDVAANDSKRPDFSEESNSGTECDTEMLTITRESSKQVALSRKSPVSPPGEEGVAAKGPQNARPEKPSPPVATDVAPVEARQLPATDAPRMEARQEQAPSETIQGEVTLMEVTQLINDIRNEFSWVFTPEKAKRFTEEISDRSCVRFPPKNPTECVQMYTALVALRRVMRLRHGGAASLDDRREPQGGAANV